MENKLIKSIVNLFIKEISKKENKDKLIDNVVNPSVEHLLEKIYPYIVFLVIVLILITLLSISTLTFLMNKKK